MSCPRARRTSSKPCCWAPSSPCSSVAACCARCANNCTAARRGCPNCAGPPSLPPPLPQYWISSYCRHGYPQSLPDALNPCCSMRRPTPIGRVASPSSASNGAPFGLSSMQSKPLTDHGCGSGQEGSCRYRSPRRSEHLGSEKHYGSARNKITSCFDRRSLTRWTHLRARAREPGHTIARSARILRRFDRGDNRLRESCFRGFNAAASLKRLPRPVVVAGRGACFRGFNAAASLKLPRTGPRPPVPAPLPRF